MYKFNLESLLRHRKFIEESKQKDFSIVQRELKKELHYLADLRAKQIELDNDYSIRRAESMYPQEFCLYREYSIRLSKEIETQQKKIDKIEIQVNIARAELLLAVKESKKLEKLKEKRKKDFDRNIAKKEQVIVNEAAVIRFNRKNQ